MKLRKTMSLFLIICLLFAMAVPVFATEAAETAEETEEAPESDNVAESSTSKIFNSPVGAALLLERSTNTVLYSKMLLSRCFRPL